jgi:NAD(P)-dependent dehydrogenase (short-subunit alcohol dehydrogenase family)
LTLTSFDLPIRAAVIGASGGIGRALTEALAADGSVAGIAAFGHSGTPPTADHVHPGRLDLEDEDSIAAAATLARDVMDGLDLVVVATGILHDRDGLAPEKSYRQLDAGNMARVLAINTIGPALVAKHFLPLLPRQGRAIFAAISARVGSIGDNGLGGWHSYRASKAALNMLLKNFAIEVGRRNDAAVVVGLHPGTVATGLSEPFRSGVPEGKLFTPAHSAARLLATLDARVPADSGHVFAYDGVRLPA